MLFYLFLSFIFGFNEESPIKVKSSPAKIKNKQAFEILDEIIGKITIVIIDAIQLTAKEIGTNLAGVISGVYIKVIGSRVSPISIFKNEDTSKFYYSFKCLKIVDYDFESL